MELNAGDVSTMLVTPAQGKGTGADRPAAPSGDGGERGMPSGVNPTLARAMELDQKYGTTEREIPGARTRSRTEKSKSPEETRRSLSEEDRFFQSKYDRLRAMAERAGFASEDDLVAFARERATKATEAKKPDPPKLELPENFSYADLSDPASESHQVLGKAIADLAARISTTQSMAVTNRVIDREENFARLTEQVPELSDPNLMREFRKFIQNPAEWDSLSVARVFLDEMQQQAQRDPNSRMSSRFPASRPIPRPGDSNRMPSLMGVNGGAFNGEAVDDVQERLINRFQTRSGLGHMVTSSR